MTWWCSATNDPWTWTPQAYPGIWLAMALLLGAYLRAWRRHPDAAADRRPGPGPGDDGPGSDAAAGGARTGAAAATTGPETALDPGPGGSAVEAREPAHTPPSARDRRKRWAFVGGWLVLWGATDWPLGSLGAGYLASAHMVQYVLYTMAAAPLLVVGTPEWMLRRLLSRLRLYRTVRLLGRPLAAAAVFNATLVVTHAPLTVDTLRTSQAASFVLDAAWLLSALLLWLPVCGPLEELKPSLPARGVYLFLAAGLVPTVPAGFLTFAGTPLYAVYELAPRVAGIGALDDQQAAGAIMKVGNIPLMWPVLAGLFIRWANQERGATTSPGGGGGSDSGSGGGRRGRPPWPTAADAVRRASSSTEPGT